MARQPIPFAEGSPPDDLQIEDFGDDEVLIGDRKRIKGQSIFACKDV